MFTSLFSGIWYRLGEINRRFQLSRSSTLIYTSHVKLVKGQVFLHVNPTISQHFTLRNYSLTHRTIVNSVCFSHLILGFWVLKKSSRKNVRIWLDFDKVIHCCYIVGLIYRRWQKSLNKSPNPLQFDKHPLKLCMRTPFDCSKLTDYLDLPTPPTQLHFSLPPSAAVSAGFRCQRTFS